MRILSANHWGLLFAPFFLFSAIHAEDSTATVCRIKTYNKLISSISARFDISPRILSSIIYVERNLNFDWHDEALDEILAKSGVNSSIGFCQVKLKTAYWIEVQLNDSSSAYWPGHKYLGILSVSETPDELIGKLQSDSLNILYAAAYLRLIQSRWENAGYPIDERADILGTLYSAGLFKPDDIERLPRSAPRANRFGQKVKESLIIFEGIR